MLQAAAQCKVPLLTDEKQDIARSLTIFDRKRMEVVVKRTFFVLRRSLSVIRLAAKQCIPLNSEPNFGDEES